MDINTQTKFESLTITITDHKELELLLAAVELINDSSFDALHRKLIDVCNKPQPELLPLKIAPAVRREEPEVSKVVTRMRRSASVREACRKCILAALRDGPVPMTCNMIVRAVSGMHPEWRKIDIQTDIYALCELGKLRHEGVKNHYQFYLVKQ